MKDKCDGEKNVAINMIYPSVSTGTSPVELVVLEAERRVRSVQTRTQAKNREARDGWTMYINTEPCRLGLQCKSATSICAGEEREAGDGVRGSRMRGS